MGGQQQQQQQMGLPQLQQPQTIWLGVMEFSEKVFNSIVIDSFNSV